MATINELIAEGKLVDAACIVYDALLGIINVGSPKMGLSREEWDKVAPKLVEKMQDPTSGGTTPTPEPGDDVEILKDKARLTVEFVVPEGYKAPKKIEKDIYVTLQYKVTAPEIEGLVPDKEVITGTMTKDGAEETVTYTEAEPVEKGTLTINYVGPVGCEPPFVAPATYEKEYNVGEEFLVESPTVEGFVPDKASVSGAMVAAGITETVTYTQVEPLGKATLTILYEGPVGDPDWVAPDPYEQEYNIGEEFMVESPVVEGYTPDKASVSGAMVKEGIEEVVTYEKETTGGGGNAGEE